MMKEGLFAGTCVSPDGQFLVGIHKPSFRVDLLRENDFIETLGTLDDGTPVTNSVNFPHNTVDEPAADMVYEIPNPFPFRGTTYINSAWADRNVGQPESISLPKPPCVSMRQLLKQWGEKLSSSSSRKTESTPSEPDCSSLPSDIYDEFISLLPRPLLLALAECSTDPLELVTIAKGCCTFQYRDDRPCGLLFKTNSTGNAIPEISDHDLFEVLANNPHLPDEYKRMMVLKPGIQGASEITGEWQLNRVKIEEEINSPRRQTGTLSQESNSNGENVNRANLDSDKGSKSHIFEYLRRNSYIPWGHFAANTADDTVRYKVNDLSCQDMQGMRHLYYQRTYLRLLDELHYLKGNERFSSVLDSLPTLEALDINLTQKNGEVNQHPRDAGSKAIGFSPEQLEALRRIVQTHLFPLLDENEQLRHLLRFNGGLWGWNFGFGYAQSGYRLHASHQQIHQQYAMVPAEVETVVFEPHCDDGRDEEGSNKQSPGLADPINRNTMASYACGDMVARFIREYRESTGQNFFECYSRAIRSNRRMDGKEKGAASLIIHEDDHVMLFVPKAQTSQWELQLMPTRGCGNILEADADMRAALDKGILMALQILERMGARMVTSIEFSKRFDSTDRDQRLLYSFLPKIPQSPGAFSEAQLRWINGHYPEDFAATCKDQLCHLSMN